MWVVKTMYPSSPSFEPSHFTRKIFFCQKASQEKEKKWRLDEGRWDNKGNEICLLLSLVHSTLLPGRTSRIRSFREVCSWDKSFFLTTNNHTF